MTLVGQVVLLRELVVACYGSELVYLLGLAFLLAGTAAGTLAGGALRHRRSPSTGAVFLGYALLLPAAVAVARALPRLFDATPGAFLPFPAQLAGLALVLLPGGLAGGLLFQRAAAAYVASSRTLAAAYALESAGGLAGGALATGALATGLGNLGTGLAAALLAAAAAALPAPRRRGTALAAAAGALALLLFGGLLGRGPLDRASTGWNHPGLVAVTDTPYGRATVTRAGQQVIVFGNGALAYESEGTAAEQFAQVAALVAPAPRAVLVLGGALEGLVAELLAHRPARVDVVELDGRLLAAVLPHLPEAARAALAAPGVRLHVGDPRRFLERRAPGGARYDLILVGLPEPDSGQTNRFYTREFFAACARRLAPEGVLALRLRGAENLWTPALVGRTASIQRALGAVFPSVLVLPGATQLLLASPAPLERDPDRLAARLAERGIRGRLVAAPYLRYLLTNDRVGALADRLAASAAPENRDGRPICYPYTLQLWLARFFPAVARLELPAPGARAGLGGLGAGAALAAALAALTWRRPVLRRALFVAGVGAFGMVLEGALLLAYQVRQGVLYQDLGLLLTLFMSGLGLGAWAVDRRFGAGAPRRAGVRLVLAAAALCLIAAALLAAGAWSGLAGTALLLLAAGAAVGALFGYASLAHGTDQAAAVAPLYAADLIGGSLGSLAGSLLLLPLAGLPATALLLGLGVLALLLFV